MTDPCYRHKWQLDCCPLLRKLTFLLRLVTLTQQKGKPKVLVLNENLLFTMSNQNQEVSFVVQNALHNNECQTMPYLLIILVCILVQFQQSCIGIELCHMDLKATDNIHFTCTIIRNLFIILTKLHQFVLEACSTLKNTTEQNNRKGQTWTHTHTHNQLQLNSHSH